MGISEISHKINLRPSPTSVSIWDEIVFDIINGICIYCLFSLIVVFVGLSLESLANNH